MKEDAISFRIKDIDEVIEFTAVTNMDLIEALLVKKVRIDNGTMPSVL